MEIQKAWMVVKKKGPDTGQHSKLFWCKILSLWLILVPAEFCMPCTHGAAGMNT